MPPPLIPEDFQFSQSSLQDYTDCRRRFYLRYLQRLSWPALLAQPQQAWEDRMEAGTLFHKLVQQHHAGVSAERLTRYVQELHTRRPALPLLLWWENYLAHFPAWLPERRIVETSVWGMAADRRCLARYDLLAIQPGEKIYIVDWKTSDKVPPAAVYERRLQTILYRFLMVQAGAVFNQGVAWLPEQVELMYWFPANPAAPIRLPYSTPAYQADQAFLARVLAEVTGLAREDFHLTENTRHCQYCAYRSYCERGAAPGALADLDDLALDLDAALLDYDATPELEV